MGKRGYNWKARQVVHTVIDDSSTKKIKLDLSVEGKYDQSNELVLPSEKRRTKVKDGQQKIQRILTNKQRKRLEKIVQKKKKKENRADLLDALSKVQAAPEELQSLTSIASVQTKGLKKYFWEQENEARRKTENDLSELPKVAKINSIAGSRRSFLIQEKKIRIDDPNVVGFDSSDSDDSEDESANDNETTEENTNTDKTDDTLNDKKEEVTEMRNGNVKAADEKRRESYGTGVKNYPKTVVKKPAVFVEVDRSDELQDARLKLPILAEEQQIMETINENSIVIIAGETGSGKTTQVPQFLYEAGYALKKMIAVTEPRRVAAISMSRRVGEEMNLTSEQISYLIRFEGNVTENTKIKFMTDGVLLKELKNDFLLTKYSVVILDEAHERSVFTDILIGLLSRIVPLRLKRGDPLKLIIMSATLRLQDFTENKRLFKVTPPVIKVDARQFPVTVHFNKRTNEDYLKEAFKKTIKIHTTLPDGGILVFLSGQREINHLVRKLKKAFPLRHKGRILAAVKQKQTRKKNKNKSESDTDSNSSDNDVERNLKKTLRNKRKVHIVPDINLDDYSVPRDQEADESDTNVNSDDESDCEIPFFANSQPLWILPMYSVLPSDKQCKVFEPPPPGCRLCVVSTNVAETSLTIPNVKYVVDTGKVKVKLFDKITGVTNFVVSWTSKASSDQRAGRAGRTGPGHCYRLYSSAVFNDVFPEFSEPEIQSRPADDLFLQMRCMNIGNILNFPFPTAPDLLQLKTAERRLEILGAVKDSKVTPLGWVISKYPVLPRFGKMLALSLQCDLLPYAICLVAALSVQEVLLETPIGQISPDQVKSVRQKWIATRRQWAGVGNSLLLGDSMVLLRAVGAAEYANFEGNLEKFCLENGLRHKAVVEIRKLRIQLTQEIKINIPEVDIVVDPKLAPPDDLQTKLLRQLLLASMGDQVAKKVALEEVKERVDKAKLKYAYHVNNMEDHVFLHQGSVLRKALPEFVIYQEIYETNRMYMRGVTAIEPEWLATYVPSLCNLSEPLVDPRPRYNSSSGKVYCTVTGTFGTQAWPLPNVEIEYPDTIDAYKWFAIFLLEGKVFTKLEKYATTLLYPANAIMKMWANSQPRIVATLKVLTSFRCRSRGDMIRVWEQHPKFLLNEYLKWLPESAYSEVILLWPPLDS